uniref:F-box domain-containing protein n=1 Tax=Ixodes ricinus TaxID=34613 RepID=A0A0K8RF38_IXORI
MDTLPLEIILYIFKFLTNHEKGIAARVCSTWKDIIDDRSLWNKSKIVIFRPMETCHLEVMQRRDIRALTIRCKMQTYNFMMLMRTVLNFEYLDISGNVCLSDYSVNLGLLYGARKYMNMRYLDISYCSQISDYTYVYLFKSMPNLLQLNISGCSRITNQVCSVFPKNLKCLQIDSTYLTDTCLIAIGNSLPSLEELYAGNIGYITDDGVIHVVKKCQLLRKLDVNLCENITDAIFPTISQYGRNLTFLNVSMIPLIDTDNVKGGFRNNNFKNDVAVLYGYENVGGIQIYVVKK